MRLSLHSLILTSALAAAAAVTPQHASAAVLHVPFAFTVNGQILPAGEYTVLHDYTKSFVTLVSADQKTFNLLVGPGEPAPGTQGVIMRFDRSDSGYALRNIQYNAMITGRLDKKSHQNEDRPVHVIRGE
jgi:hypothetical protein